MKLELNNIKDTNLGQVERRIQIYKQCYIYMNCTSMLRLIDCNLLNI